MKVDRIWWHELSPEDFFSMEKTPRPGVRGKSSIELRRVPELLEFFGYSTNLPADRWSDVTLDVNVVGAPERQMPLRFASHRRHGTFELIGQNPHEERSGRHPAWTTDFHWPETSVPADLDDASDILAEVGGIHLYVIRTQNGRHWAGATVGSRLPVTWPDSLAPLFTGTGSGVITIGQGSMAKLTPLARQILSAFRDRKNVLVYGPRPPARRMRSLRCAECLMRNGPVVSRSPLTLLGWIGRSSLVLTSHHLPARCSPIG